MAAHKVQVSSKECNVLPHVERTTAVVENVKVPRDRRALFLAVDNDALHDKFSDELCFGALSPDEKATFQFLLYLTYCCKGELLQVTLENPDFCSMSPPIREDFAHGRLFCFVLDTSDEESSETNDRLSQARSCSQTADSEVSYFSGTRLLSLMNVDVSMDVFRRGQEENEEESEEEREDSPSHPETHAAETEPLLEEAFRAFMRLQLVRKKISSLNNAMIVMRDGKGELGSVFDWVDIGSDTLRSNKLDKKKVKELQGSMYTPACQSGRQVVVLPEPIADLNLKELENCVGRITDSAGEGEGKELFLSLISKLTCTQWEKQKVVQAAYDSRFTKDLNFLKRVKAFTRDLASGSTGTTEVNGRGLVVFRYSTEKLIDTEYPNMFAKSLIHRHMTVTETQLNKVLCVIKSKCRTRAIARLLNEGRCHCEQRKRSEDGSCGGACQTAYSCFYNWSEQHPFAVSRDDHSYYFAHLYPHLGKLERLSKEMKLKYRGRRQFESIADMVFNILVRHRFTESGSLYEGLSDVIDEKMSNSSLSVGRSLADVHESLYLAPCVRDQEPGAQDPVKVYDQALVRYLFCEGLQVGRLFQASTTFNYIVSNTAPRYTIERIMLFNITGPGEGKSYANNVLNYQFRRVRGCIETLTSFTPQAFKYKRKRNACVVMIDDAHITHEKNVKAADKESNVIPNTFKNLLDNSVLESDVTTRDANGGRSDTVKYQAVHNCGFVWNTNTMGFVSEAWADRCLIMESEFPERVTRTRSTKQIQDMVEKRQMDRLASVCLYRQNLIQSATMIAESDFMQFGARFDAARDACVKALYASHIVCTRVVSRRLPFCINQLVFAEAMKLACHFVFDVWIPPWTEIPDEKAWPDLRGYMKQMNGNRLKALDKLSFGQICLETDAVYKLCTAACLPDICPRAVDTQGRFACKVLAYILTQVHEQQLKNTWKKSHVCISGIDAMFFSESEIAGGNDAAHETIPMCATCEVPSREGKNPTVKNYKLCTYRYATNQNTQNVRRVRANPHKKVGSVTVPLEAAYDLLALYAPASHSGFWDQVGEAMLQAYNAGDFEDLNAFGQCVSNGDGGQQQQQQQEQEQQQEQQRPHPTRLKFTLNFNEDPVRSIILEATAAIEPLNEISFNKCVLGGEVFQCSAPLYYGGVIRRAMSENAPEEAYDADHHRESKLGPRGTFHGPRLNVYSAEYSGVPVKNVSSFCTTRTVYHQDKILLRVDRDKRSHLFELEEDWEWKDAAEVFNNVHGAEAFSVESLKRDYAATMVAVKGDAITAEPRRSTRLGDLLKVLREADGRAALSVRKGIPTVGSSQDTGTRRSPTQSGHKRKRTNSQRQTGVKRARLENAENRSNGRYGDS